MECTNLILPDTDHALLTDSLILPDMDHDLLKLITPFSLVIGGPSGSGKSKFLFDLLDNLPLCTDPPIEKVVFIYGVYQSIYAKYPNIHFTSDLEAMKIRPVEKTLLIIDDCMSAIKDDSALEALFTRGRHENISTVLILQKKFYKGSVFKTCRDNASYLALTNHIQDQTQLYTFSNQLEVKGSQYFIKAYEDVIKTRFNYIFIDHHHKSLLCDAPFFIKYRSSVHQPGGQVVYIDPVKYKAASRM